jgi:glycosyltransferase involved in cell wall biosynthesis
MFRAARIIAGSHFTQAELEAARPDAQRRVTVVGYGVNDAFRQTVAAPTLERLRQPYGSDRPLIVHVGSCQPRKNLEAILKALPDLSELGVTFVQVGGRFTPAQADLIEALHLRAAVHQVTAPSDEVLRAWYQAADVFVFPSLYEGFGLPVLEAMASGTPVVCAHHGAVAEVAGDAAMLVDPHDPRAFSRALREVLTQPTLQRDLRAKGRARSLEFTWASVARATWQIYQNVYDDRRHAFAGTA